MERAQLIRRGLRMLEAEIEAKCHNVAARNRNSSDPRTVAQGTHLLEDLRNELALIRKILKELSITYPE